LTHPPQATRRIGIVLGILDGFLSHEDGSSSCEFIWEHHFKLKRISVHYGTWWEVASKSRVISETGDGEWRTATIQDNGQREVLYRNIIGVDFVPARKDPDCVWIKKVAEDMA
jgi:hypothetical protein